MALRTLAYSLAVVWLAPALMFNIDWTGHAGWASNTAAAFMILGSAAMIEGSLRARSFVMSPLLAIAALILVYSNSQVAFETLAGASEGRSEARKSAMSGASHLASQRSQWVAARKEQVDLAGETAAASFESQLQEIKISDSRRWQLTNGCDAHEVIKSKDFCLKVAGVEKKLSAAKKRDELDAKIEAQDTKTADVVVPTSADPYAENVASFLGIFGIRFDEESKRAIAAQKTVARTIGLELLATFGPTAWILFLNGVFAAAAHIPVPAGRAASLPSRDKCGAPPATLAKPSDVPAEDPWHRWVADDLEEATAGEGVKSGVLWRMWQDWCRTRVVPTGTQQAFWNKMKGRFVHDANNGRPRYLGLRVREKNGPRLVVSNA